MNGVCNEPICRRRWRRHVVSEGPLRGPQGTSVVVDVAMEVVEYDLSSGAGSEGAIRGPSKSLTKTVRMRWGEGNARSLIWEKSARTGFSVQPKQTHIVIVAISSFVDDAGYLI